jgi:hypothetical protein
MTAPFAAGLLMAEIHRSPNTTRTTSLAYTATKSLGPRHPFGPPSLQACDLHMEHGFVPRIIMQS